MLTSIFSLRALPLFSAFFLWSLGTGAVNLARPLFAIGFGVPVFLVTMVTASNSVAHLVSGPITGVAIDRWGRKPLLLMGLAIRAASGFGQFFAQGYVDYLILEFIGGLGVAMWGTGSAVLIADLSVGENRGRAVAARSTAARLGMLIGPTIGGIIAAAVDLRAIFLFNGITKATVLLIVLFMIRETSPQREEGGRRHPTFDASLMASFMTRPFLIIMFISLIVSMMTQGVFASLFPIFLKDSGNFTTTEMGTLQTIAGLAILLIAMPNGYLVDKFGRKVTLIPGLIILGCAAAVLSLAVDVWTGVLVVVLYGIGTGMCQGAAHVYVMDLAPPDRRGSFLGMWALIESSGGAVAPITIGLIAEHFGFPTAFTVTAATLGVAAVLMWALGPDTYGHRTQNQPTSSGAASH